jgi:hypothetical protein
VISSESKSRGKDACLVLATKMVEAQAVIPQFRDVHGGTLAIRQFHPDIALIWTSLS